MPARTTVRPADGKVQAAFTDESPPMLLRGDDRGKILLVAKLQVRERAGCASLEGSRKEEG